MADSGDIDFSRNYLFLVYKSISSVKIFERATVGKRV